MTFDPYIELLDATIRHLEGLKARGEVSVPASPELLAALRKPVAAKPQVRRTELNPASSQPRATLTGTPVSPAPAPAAPAPRISNFSVKREPVLPSASAPVAAPLQSKETAIAALRERVLQCSQCSHLAAARTNIVFGVGNVDADLMFVGEAPGADEDRKGEPFVGAAGQLLNKIIIAMGLRREQVYIANILKCRPDTPGQTSGNRKPVPAEMATCIPYLQEQIRIIQPKVIVGLGATAIEGLLGKTEGITRARGKWHVYQGIPLMPTYHPAYLLHNQSNTEKRKVWEDMMQVMGKLGLPISEKQRGYFL